jgi:MinD superfamily P-loop ATPase
LLRKEAQTLAKQNGFRRIISDGPPGIGCPVISALSGQDLAVIVTEPTPSGRHDLERVLELCGHFKIPVAVIVNKCDLNPGISREIEDYCTQRDIPTVAQLPHDTAVTHAMVQRKTITEYTREGVSTDIRDAWERILSLVEKQ